MGRNKHKKICEIYVSGDRFKANIPQRISDFVKMCEFLLRSGIDTFYIYDENSGTNLCKEILNLYKNQYNIQIAFRNKKFEMCKRMNSIIIFNWNENVVAYDKDFIKIQLVNDCEKPIPNNEPIDDLTKIDLMP
ncbi:MAG: hypothetical protein IJ458_02725 [Clostridia bacterium]|nr:hypothetical protein [Clostridia bacterium]